MLRNSNALPRTPASTAATPFANRVAFMDENHHHHGIAASDAKLLGVTKTPKTVGKLGTGDQQQQQHQRRRVALGDISNRKAPTQQLQQPSITKSATTTTTTTKKKQALFLPTSATKQTNVTQQPKQPTIKRVNFAASVQEPALETDRPRVLFSVPTPIPKKNHGGLSRKIWQDTEDDDFLDESFPVEDVERPAGRLWSEEEHGFGGGEHDDPRDDISLEEGSRHFMADLRTLVQESRVKGIQDEIRRRDEEAQQYMEHSFPQLLQEQWDSGKSLLFCVTCPGEKWIVLLVLPLTSMLLFLSLVILDLAVLDDEPLEMVEDPVDLALHYLDDDFEIRTNAAYFVCDISF